MWYTYFVVDRIPTRQHFEPPDHQVAHLLHPADSTGGPGSITDNDNYPLLRPIQFIQNTGNYIGYYEYNLQLNMVIGDLPKATGLWK